MNKLQQKLEELKNALENEGGEHKYEELLKAMENANLLENNGLKNEYPWENADKKQRKDHLLRMKAPEFEKMTWLAKQYNMSHNALLMEILTPALNSRVSRLLKEEANN